MRPGQESQTSLIVALSRAVAHDLKYVDGFSDPPAADLLPPAQRERLEQFKRDRAAGVKPRIQDVILEKRSKAMAVRSMAVDRTLRALPHTQVVVLGAGMDTRAWRLPQWNDATVFEVDHPDTQAAKRERAAALTPTAGDLRYVPVDFTKDDLATALNAAGHDPSKPTTWLWEGVVMYLTRAEIEATLEVVSRRSAPGSGVVIVYSAPAWLLWLVGPVLRRVGEPLRSAFKPNAMRILLEAHGLTVEEDLSVPEAASAISAGLGAELKALKHMRIVRADKPGTQ